MLSRFIAARGQCKSQPVDPRNPDFTNLGCVSGDQRSVESLIGDLEAATAQEGWLIFCFHGFGVGTHSMYVDEAEHRKFLGYLESMSSVIWTAPVGKIAGYLASSLPEQA